MPWGTASGRPPRRTSAPNAPDGVRRTSAVEISDDFRNREAEIVERACSPGIEGALSQHEVASRLVTASDLKLTL
jgi:hypothetical protein